MASANKTDLIGTGAVGNQTSASKPVNPDCEFVAFRCACEAIGATPAITWLIQGSMDDPSVPDANSLFDPIGYVTEASDTVAFAARTGPIVAGSAQTLFHSLSNRKYRKYRAVITGVLNVTYRVEMFTVDVD